MHNTVFIFKKFHFFWGGGGGMNMNTIFEHVNWLSNNQKPFVVIAVDAEEAIIHSHMPEEAMKSWVC